MARRGRKKHSEVYQLSEDAVGAVSITMCGSTSAITVHFDDECRRALGTNKVLIGRHNLTVAPAGIDKEGLKICASGNVGMSFNKIASDDIVGIYEMVPEGKHFKLYKIETNGG